jgi:hypothetical protein
MIRQEDPGRQEKVMFLSPRAPHAGQALEFGFLEPPPMGKQPATDEKESVGHYQAAQAGHGGELYAQSHVHEPQSLWSTRLCATPLYNGHNSPYSSFQSNINGAGKSLTNPANGYNLTNTSTMYKTYCNGADCSNGLTNLNNYMGQQGAKTNALHNPCKH